MTINVKKSSGVHVQFIVPERIAYTNVQYIPMPKTLPPVTRKTRRPIAKLAAAWLL